MLPNDWADSGTLLGAIVAIGFGLRHALSKLNLTTASDSANQALITNLQNERNGWKKSYEEAHRSYLAQKENNMLLRTQVLMMRQMLIAKGMTEQELIAIGAVIPPESKDDMG